MRRYFIAALLVGAFVPTPARADWLFTPSLGSTFGGDTNGSEHFTYGLSFGWLGIGTFGWEADLSFTPEFFEGADDDFDFDGGSNVATAMANFVLTTPVTSTNSGVFRPYFTAGVGMLQTEARSNDDLFAVDNSEFGFNLGVGAMGFVSNHVGFRGDVRYLRSFIDPDEDNEFDIAVGNFDYWRGSVGLTFRW
jgi:hypothetical protein